MIQENAPSPDLGLIMAERRRYFTPSWFADLLSARLGLGDTFWIGNYGTALIFVPMGMLLVLPGRLVLPPAGATWLIALWFALVALFFLALTVAMLRLALRTPAAGGWRWLGVVLTASNAVSAALLAPLLAAGIPLG